MNWARLVGAASALLLAACAGNLDPVADASVELSDGSLEAGPGPGFTPCLGAATKSCSAEGCHAAAFPAAGLVLTVDAMTKNYHALYLDRPNGGTDGVTMPGDPKGCAAGGYKLVDSANVAASLIYMKAIPKGDATQPPCGTKMPVVGMFTAADRACILAWINDVVAAGAAP